MINWYRGILGTCCMVGITEPRLVQTGLAFIPAMILILILFINREE